ncbi:2Fe-2S iron-sulfur cluster-binding protein [Streptomyces sp. NPDC088387]|uniref:2Fe-2S iron-sulfur cluster-binding protein n=1 Tax=Streptomyces sp. NPDC088387 TaxID=3365859 RepID=UPI00380E0D05
MTDDQHGEGAPQGAGRWDPLPQGEYDDGATAFVKLPEGGIDALLAAPGHGYVPPPIAPAPPADPAANGTWSTAPADGAQWPAPDAVPHDTGRQDGGRHNAGGHDTGHHDTGQHHTGHHDTGHHDIGRPEHFAYNPGATGQWNFEDAAAGAVAPAPGHDVTGQWSIPVANGDLPDESGEFTTSSLVEQWGGTPPATLPGGAAAPWATEGGAGESWAPAPEAPDLSAAPGALPAEAPAAPPGVNGSHGVAQEPHEATEGPAEPSEEPAGESRPTALSAAPETDVEPVAEPVPDGGEGSDGSNAPDGEDDPGTPDASGTPVEAPTPPHDDHPLASYVLRVNGADRPVTDAWIGESLLYVLRERLGLAGAKDGCSQGECGACNVQVDGRLVASCLVPAVTAAGSEVRTVEGLATDGQPSDVQRALAKCGAVQCGFCVPGMAMTVHDLLEGNPAPTELETRQALCGNLCRCSGYRGVVDAVKDVVAERSATSTAGNAEHNGDEPRIPHQAGPGAGGVNPSAFESPRTQGHDQAFRPGPGQDGGQA